MSRPTRASDRKSIVVTGASSGIGRATAERLASEGHHVFAVGRREHELSALSGEHPEITPVPLDVTDEPAVRSVLERVEAETAGRGLDGVVNAAGTMIGGPIESASDADARGQFEVNLFGLLSVTRAVIPSMRVRGSGRIVNISSILGRFVLPGSGLYAASKFAVEACSDALRLELAPFGIQVVVVEPGITSTALGNEFPERLRRGAVSPSTVADVVVRAAVAANPRARYVVGGRNRLNVGLLTALPTRIADTTKRRVVGQPPAS
jgi:NAD(P)-dependent dehydrogenase (short-subunit alcohol dehydrogenase family)